MLTPAWLERMIANGSVPYRDIPETERDLVEQLRRLNLVAVAVTRSRKYVEVVNPTALHEWMERKFAAPSGAPDGQRATNIYWTRDSKRGVRRHSIQPVLLRCFSATPAWLWATVTQRCGMAGFTSDRIHELAPPSPWYLVTIENWEPFTRATYAPREGAIVVLYTSGQISEVALRAITAIQPPPAACLHVGDYDWDGLAIYRRIRAVLPSAQLYVPNDLDDLFRTAANHALAHRQSPTRAMPDDPPEVQRVMALISHWNAGLEQEIVPLPSIVDVRSD